MNQRWPLPLVVIHWLTVLLLVALIAVGVTMVDLAADDPLRRVLGTAHAIAGVTLGLLTFARLLVRKLAPAPEPLALPPLQRRFAGLVQGLLYLGLFGLGASGVGTALGSDWHAFLDGDLSRAPELGALLSRRVHEALVAGLVGLSSIHVAGVALQQLRKGGVLRRMRP